MFSILPLVGIGMNFLQGYNPAKEKWRDPVLDRHSPITKPPCYQNSRRVGKWISAGIKSISRIADGIFDDAEIFGFDTPPCMIPFTGGEDAESAEGNDLALIVSEVQI
jgi:hypothetical protein